MRLSKREVAAVTSLERRGRIEKLALFKAARSPTHPSHKRFIWNKQKAWMQKNLEIAGDIIRRVHFVRTIVDDRGVVHPLELPTYVRSGKKDAFVTLELYQPRRAQSYSLVALEVGQAIGSMRRALSIALFLKLGDAIEPHLAALEQLRQLIREQAASAEEPQREAAE